MQFDPDFSVYWREHLELHGSDQDYIGDGGDRYPLIFEATVEDVRDLRGESGKQFYVAYTPKSDEAYGCSHVSVLMLSRDKDAEVKALRQDLSVLFEPRYGSPTVPIPEGA
jgi:hypothetical protein